MVIDILETYLILRQSDQCSRIGGCQVYIGIREISEDSRVGTFTWLLLYHGDCSAHVVPELHRKTSFSLNYTHISALGFRNTFHASLQVKNGIN